MILLEDWLIVNQGSYIIEMGESGEAGSDKVGQEEEWEETDSPSKGGDGNGCSTLCNIFIKFTLFLTNFIIWVSACSQKNTDV